MLGVGCGALDIPLSEVKDSLSLTKAYFRRCLRFLETNIVAIPPFLGLKKAYSICYLQTKSLRRAAI